MNRLALQLPARALTSLRHARANQFTALALKKRQNVQNRQRSTKGPAEDQATPLTGYWAEMLGEADKGKSEEKDILDEPLGKIQPATRTAPKAPPTDELPKTDKEERMEKARVVFGSRLAGPAERRRVIDAASHDVAGIMVPPKPEEPDNCCMSGCVNCVWDVYRDDLEEWASKSAEAREKLQAQRSSGAATGTMINQKPGMPSHIAVSMDDDGGGSETNWNTGVAMSGDKGDLFANIPIGIREFMRTEKMLKKKHSEEKGAEA